jgi:hypothetical protein
MVSDALEALLLCNIFFLVPFYPLVVCMHICLHACMFDFDDLLSFAAFVAFVVDATIAC